MLEQQTKRQTSWSQRKGSTSSVLRNMLVIALCKFINRIDIHFELGHMCVLDKLLFRHHNRKHIKWGTKPFWITYTCQNWSICQSKCRQINPFKWEHLQNAFFFFFFSPKESSRYTNTSYLKIVNTEHLKYGTMKVP